MEGGLLRRPGWGLVAAGLVLAIGAAIRMAQGEPIGALGPLSAVFTVLGVGTLVAGRHRRL